MVKMEQTTEDLYSFCLAESMRSTDSLGTVLKYLSEQMKTYDKDTEWLQLGKATGVFTIGPCPPLGRR